MNISLFIQKVKRASLLRFTIILYSKCRVYKYKLLSDCKNVLGKPIKCTPALINGLGKVIFNQNVTLGVWSSPFFFNSYIYIEARNELSIIEIDSGVIINNNATIISDGEGIYIGKNTLIGSNFSVYDSDFHDLHIYKRLNRGLSAAVVICENVFIGSNVTVLKGVNIGANSVISNGAVVTKSIPANVVAGGVPCIIIKELDKKYMQI
jgi:acetyltransferase-like isoleucine patch superfamily enzyme